MILKNIYALHVECRMVRDHPWHFLGAGAEPSHGRCICWIWLRDDGVDQVNAADMTGFVGRGETGSTACFQAGTRGLRSLPLLWH